MKEENSLTIKQHYINGLKAPNKRHGVAEWIRKQHSYICCLQQTCLRSKHAHRLKVNGWKKISHASGKGKRGGVVVLISNKIDFKTKATVRDKEGHYIMIMGTIQQEDITLVYFIHPT